MVGETHANTCANSELATGVALCAFPVLQRLAI